MSIKPIQQQSLNINNYLIASESQLSLNEVVEHVVGCMGFLAGYHVACSVYDVVDQIVLVFGYPSF